jgi:mono/diheme cytochrome c family protein
MKTRFMTATGAVILLVSGWSGLVPLADAAADPGVRGGAPAAGNPVQGLSADQTTLFVDGQKTFAEAEQIGDGLGPRFNLDSCGGCHSQPASGGSSPSLNPQVALATAFGARNVVPSFITANGPVREAHFKLTSTGARDGGVHALFVTSGRIDNTGSANNCRITQDDFDGQMARGNVALRIPTPTYGLGLIENIPDSNLIANLGANAARKSNLGIGGHLNHVGNDGTVSRYGWKAQNGSLLMFSGEAYNVEMGISNELFQEEREQNANCQQATTPNDVSGKTGLSSADLTLSDVEKFAVYMRFLGAPMPAAATAAGGASVRRGAQQFDNIGCGLCHSAQLTTGNATVKALANQKVNLYSDLALHRMGPRLADNVLQGAAAGDEFRTAPLWGLGQRIFFLHDGRTGDLLQAIQAHASGGGGGNGGSRSQSPGPSSTSSFGPSEANEVIGNFNDLNDAAQQDVLNFLRSL